MIFQICEADGSSAVTCNEKPWWQFMAFLFAHTHAHIRCSFPSETRIKYAYANAHTHSRLHKRTYAHKHIWFPVEHLREGTVRIVPSIAPDRQGSLKPGVRSPVNATRQLFAGCALRRRCRCSWRYRSRPLQDHVVRGALVSVMVLRAGSLRVFWRPQRRRFGIERTARGAAHMASGELAFVPANSFHGTATDCLQQPDHHAR
jgi:hypothetical protein